MEADIAAPQQAGHAPPPDLNQMPDVPMGEYVPINHLRENIPYVKPEGIPGEQGTKSRTDAQSSKAKQSKERQTKNFREQVDREAAEEAARYAKTKRKAPFKWEAQKGQSNQGGKEPDDPEPGSDVKE